LSPDSCATVHLCQRRLVESGQGLRERASDRPRVAGGQWVGDGNGDKICRDRETRGHPLSLLLSHPPAPCNSSSTTPLSHQLLNRAWGNSCPGLGDPADGARHSFPMHGRTRNMEFHRQLRKISTENVWSSEMVFLSALRGTVAQLVFNQRAGFVPTSRGKRNIEEG
jgi:hypothetical protein